MRLNLVHLHQLVAVVVDHLDGDAACVGIGEGTTHRRVERGPGFFVDLGPEGSHQTVIGLVGAGEVAVATGPTADRPPFRTSPCSADTTTPSPSPCPPDPPPPPPPAPPPPPHQPRPRERLPPPPTTTPRLRSCA